MKLIIISTFLIFLTALNSMGQKVYNLDEIIAFARENSVSNKIAKSRTEESYYSFLDYKAGLKPQLSLSGNLLNFNKDFFGVYQPDGTLVFLPRTQNYSTLQAGLTQKIGLTGGILSLNSTMARFDDYVGRFRHYNGIPFNIQISQPIGGFNPLKWQKKIEPLKLEESQKVYARSIADIAHQACVYYLNVLDAQENLKLLNKNLESQSLIYDIESKKIDLGTSSRERILQLQLAVLNLQQELKSSELVLKSAVNTLKAFVGLRDSTDFMVTVPDNLPAVTITLDQALDYSRKNRSEYTSYKRLQLEAERDLKQAQKEGFSVNVTAALGYNNTGSAFYEIYVNPLQQQSAIIGIQIPIVDWGRMKYKQKQAFSNLKTANYMIEQEEEAIRLEITNLMQNIALSRNNIEIAKQAAEISAERYELSKVQIGLGKLSITDLNISLREKDEAQRAYLSSLRNYWDSYYQLQSLTLSAY